jgi:pimeloyl-ACP methyl ester carboxylesterase
MTQAQENKSTTVRSRRGVPAGVRSAVGLLQSVSPVLAAWAVEPLFLTPQRHARPEHERAAYDFAQRRVALHRGKRVPLYSWGEGPVVLFAHGWEGRATQVAPFIEPLVAAGFRVVAYDVLGHGEAPRALVSVVDFAAVALSVIRELGEPVHAAIGHSIGATALTLAAAEQPFTERLVLIAPPLHPRGFIRSFCQELALTTETRDALVRRLEARYALPFEQLDAGAHAADIEASALIVHDRGDRDVPFAHGQELASAFRHARFVATDDLGHHRILRDRGIVQLAVECVGVPVQRESLTTAISRELFERDARLASAG